MAIDTKLCPESLGMLEHYSSSLQTTIMHFQVSFQSRRGHFTNSEHVQESPFDVHERVMYAHMRVSALGFLRGTDRHFKGKAYPTRSSLLKLSHDLQREALDIFASPALLNHLPLLVRTMNIAKNGLVSISST